ncbi:MAG: phosphoesterase [Desulfurococcaceae archaeon]
MFHSELPSFIETYKSFTIVPDTSLDSLIAAGILFKKLSEHGFDVSISLNAKLLLDYRDDPAIVINIPPVNKQKHVYLGTSDKSSVSAQVTYLLDELMGMDVWDKELSIIAGLYRGLYDVKSGVFTGIEDVFLKELISNKAIYEVTGLRLWGAKRRGIVSALTRTLLPYIPGVSGNADVSVKLVSEVYKGVDPYTIRQKELTGDRDKDSLFTLIKIIVDSTKDPQLAFKLIGDFYVSIPGLSEAADLEAHEVMGSLVVYESICENCPLDLALLPIERSILPQVICIYDEVADQVALHVSSQLDSVTKGGSIESNDIFKRPDLIVDILQYMNALPPGRVIKLSADQGYITSLRELIRAGVKPEEAYTACGDNQLCPVE